jgi:hypothetical protein
MRRALLLGLLLAAGCKKETPAPAPAAAPKPLGKLPEPGPKPAEVEIGGTYSPGSTHPAKVYVALLDAPCLPVPEAPKVIGSDVPTRERFFMEIFVPQGAKGYICLYGLDAQGKVTSAAGWEKNPFVMQGSGEVQATVSMTLEPVAPVEPPRGLVSAPGHP